MNDGLGEALAGARPRVLAALAHQFRDLDLAEEALSAAIETLLRQDEIPRDVAGWIYVAARRKALDLIRRQKTEARALSSAALEEEMAQVIELPEPIPDERLRLLFVCCHPALALEARMVLALRVICGVPVRDIASALLVNEPAAYQRITRAKGKIKKAGIPFETPPPAEWRARLEGVLATLEAAYSLAYRDGAGTSENAALGPEVERLAIMLAELLPDQAEALGLAALVLLARSREAARVDAQAIMVPLSRQDTALWDRRRIERARALVDRANALKKPGPRQVMAAIHLTHAMRAFSGATDWAAIAKLYQALETMRPSAMTRINRAAAVGRAQSAEAGLALLATLDADSCATLLPFHVARADLLERSGSREEAVAAFDAALLLDPCAAEARYLARRRDALR